MSRRTGPTVSIGGAPNGFFGDDRAVSNVVGYVLVFSLVTVTIGVVFAVGITGVEERQNAERVANVERAFDVFDDNLRDVQRYDDPSRSTEMRLSGGTLSTAETAHVRLRNESGAVLLERRFHSLTYEADDTRIAYEMGAWFRTDGDATVMRSEPRFVADADRTTLPLVLLYPSGDRTVAGEGTLQIRAGGLRSNTGPDYGAAGHETLELEIESPHSAAWERYFERTDGFGNVSATDGAVTATLEHDDTVYVHRIALDVTMRR